MKPTANAAYLELGAGTVLFDRYINGARTGFREIGNVESFARSISVERVEKKDDTDGARQTLADVITGSTVEISMVFNEFRPENIALAELGELDPETQISQNITSASINAGDPLEFDRWYDLGGFRNQVTSVAQGGPALTVDVDYEVSDDGSMVRLLSTGGASDTVATTWTGYQPGLAIPRIKGGTTPRIVGHLRFVAATNQVVGKRKQADYYYVSITPDGERGFIGEEFGSATLNAKVERDPNRAVGAPLYEERLIPLASEATS